MASQSHAITGGAGFICSSLAGALVPENEVVLINDLSSGKRENLCDLDVGFIKGSITDLELLKSAIQGDMNTLKKMKFAPELTLEIGLRNTIEWFLMKRCRSKPCYNRAVHS